MEVVERHLGLRVNVFEVPTKVLALEVVPEFSARGEIPDVNVACPCDYKFQQGQEVFTLIIDCEAKDVNQLKWLHAVSG